MSEDTKIWKILLIDDDEDDYLITREMLADTKGARVHLTWAASYRAAQDILLDRQIFDAVLVDYDLGVHTGLDLIREANRTDYPAPMILLTGRGSYEVDVEAMQAGASIYLSKNEVNALLLERSIRYAIERKRTEDALRASEDRYRKLVSVMPAGVFTCDAEGEITFYNQQAADIWGQAPFAGDSKLRFSGSWRMYDLDGVTLISPEAAPIAEVLKTGQAYYDYEVIVERPDGSRVVVMMRIDPLLDSQGQVSGAINVFVDVTERKRAEEERLLALARLEQVFDSAVVGITISDKTGKLVQANDYYLRLTGWSRADLENGRARWDTITPPEHMAADIQALREIQETGSCKPFEKEYLRADGTRVWVLIYVSELHGEKNLIVSFVLNITEQKRAEQALRESELRFRVLADAMPQLVWTANPDGVVDYYNQRYREYAGIAPGINGTWEWGPVLHEADLQVTVDAWKYALRDGKTYEVQHRVRMADGSFRWHLSRGVPVRDEHGVIVKWYGTATDIHDQKHALDSIQNSD